MPVLFDLHRVLEYNRLSLDIEVQQMPLYEYHCPHCEIKFTSLRLFSKADAPATCPQCGGQDTKRAISLFATLSKSADGSTKSVGDSSCAGCSSGSCAHCHH